MARERVLEVFTIFLFLILNIVALSFLAVIVYNILCYADIEKYNLTFIVILITSIATSAFFLIKIYIENQLGVKEKQMLKEYQDALDKQTRKQDDRFKSFEEKHDLKMNNLISQLNNNFNTMSNDIKGIKEFQKKLSTN